MQPWDTHEPAGDWIPLASAPALEYLGGYQIGYRLQASGEPNELQRVALTVAGVPDGQPSQPYNAQPYCVTRIGRRRRDRGGGAGAAVRGRRGLHGHRVGRAERGRRRRLPGGAVEHRARSRSARASRRRCRRAAELPRRRRPRQRRSTACARRPARRRGRHPLRARRARAARRLGGRRGRRARGDDDHAATVPEDAFPRPGVWTCVARGTAEGVDEGFSRTVFGGALVRRRSRSRCAATSAARAAASPRPRSTRPRFTFTAEWPGLRERRQGHDHALPRDGLQRPRRTACAASARFRGRFGARTRPRSRSAAPARRATTSAASRSAARTSCARASTRPDVPRGHAPQLRLRAHASPAARATCRPRSLLGRADPAAALRGQDRARGRRARGPGLARVPAS